MINLLQNIFIWLFFAPGLLLAKDIQPWYKRVFLVLIAPSTWMILMFLSMVTAILFTSPDDFFGYPHNVYHKYKSAADISYVTQSYIPECDTLGAEFHPCGIDFDIQENFILKRGLTKQDKDSLTNLCEHSSQWSETDTTYNYVGGDVRHDYDYFHLEIDKRTGKLIINYGTY